MNAARFLPPDWVQVVSDGESLALVGNPGRFDRLVRKDDFLDEGVAAIFGLIDGKVELLAVAFHSRKFNPDQAAAWLAERKMVPGDPN